MVPGRRILFVVTGLGWGGAESQVIDLGIRLRNQGFEIHVATLLGDPVRRSALDAEGIPVHSLGMRRGLPDPRAILRLARVVRKIRPDVVHSHMVHANLLSRVVRTIAPMPALISSAHNVEEGAAWRILAYRITDRLCDLTTNVSAAAVRRSVERGSAPAHRIRCMPNGIDLDRFRSDWETRGKLRDEMGLADRFVWLAVGSFEEQKDYPNLFRAVSEMKDHQRRPVVLVVGEGSLRERLEDQAMSARLTDCARFLGVREDIPALMNTADAFVMSSAWEGLPIVLLEAAASGLPIVATNVGGVGEIVLDGRSGFLVPPRAAGPLGEAMLRVMDLPDHSRVEMGTAGAKHVRAMFNLEQIVDRWIEVYERILSSRNESDAG